MASVELWKNFQDQAARRLGGMLPPSASEDFRHLGLRELQWDRKPGALAQVEVADELLGIPEELEDDFFAWLAASRASAGRVIRVPEGQKVSLPIHTLSSIGETGTSFGRTWVVCEPGSELTWVEEWGGGSGYPPGAFAAHLTQIVVKRGAKLKHVQIQDWPEDVEYFHRQSLRIEADATVESVHLGVGGKKGQVRAETRLLGRGAKLLASGAVRGDGTQVFDFWPSTLHSVPDTSSEFEYWTVMSDRAHAIFNGKIVITAEALRTDASQRNRNMLLSPKAAIDTHPRLEIATDEVRCAHGASVSPVNWEQIFYLRSRGIPEQEARSMIVDGFTEPVVQKFPTDELRERARDLLTRKRRKAGLVQDA